MNDEALRDAIRGSFDDVRMGVPASTLAARASLIERLMRASFSLASA